MYNKERVRKPSPSNTRAGALAFEALIRQSISQLGSAQAALVAMAPKPVEKPLTFAEFTERWIRDYVDGTNSPTTQLEKRRVLQRHILPAFGCRKLPEIDAQSIHRFIADLRATGLGPKTINNVLTVLRKALDTACDWQLLDHLPRMKFLPTPDATFKFLLPTQVDALIAAAEPGLWRAMITFAVRTGLRFSELAGLEWSAVDRHHGAHGMVAVCRKNVRGLVGPPKNNRIRHIPLTSDALDALDDAASFAIPSGTNLVFTFAGKFVGYTTALDNLVRICRAAGVPQIGWHDLRHTFATHLVSVGAPLKAIQDLLGHSTIEMTMRYAHLAPDIRHAAIALLETGPEGPLSQYCHNRPFRASSTVETFAVQGTNLGSTKQKTLASASAS